MVDIDLNNNPEQMQASANHTDGCCVEFSGQLGRLGGTQGALAVSFSSPGAGTELQNALTNAGSRGRALLRTMDEIIIALRQAGVTIDDTDNAARGTIAGVGVTSKISPF
ncbi:hypothetical protein ACWIGW_39170 [Nocardia brasiliensis]